MKRYEILQPTTLTDGLVVLNKDQARRRIHLLKLVDGDIYEIIRKVQFKAGELIGWDGEVTKGMLSHIMPIVDPEENDDSDADGDEDGSDSEDDSGSDLDADSDADGDEDILNRILALKAEGKKPGEIGASLGIPHQTVSKMIREAK